MHATATVANRTRRLVARLAMLTVVLAGFLMTATPALMGRADAAASLSPQEQDYVNRVNDLRAAHGLNRLLVDPNTEDLATSHTAEMVATQDLHHTPDLTAGLTTDWQKVGENVGMGSNTDIVWNAFVNSPHHYANLVDPAFTHIGVSVMVDAKGIQWTTHRFVSIAHGQPAAPAPTPPPAPAPVKVATPVTPAPAPVHLPVVTTPAPTTVPVAPAPAPVEAPHASAVLDAMHGI